MPFVPDNRASAAELRHAELLSILTAFQTEWRTAMADLNADLDTLASDIQTELQQLRDAVAAAQAAINDKAALEQALADAQAIIDGASARVQQFSADLKADDPAPAGESA